MLPVSWTTWRGCVTTMRTPGSAFSFLSPTCPASLSISPIASLSPSQLEYVAWVCDQDAYACSGQKCSAQSILFMHEVLL